MGWKSYLPGTKEFEHNHATSNFEPDNGTAGHGSSSVVEISGDSASQGSFIKREPAEKTPAYANASPNSDEDEEEGEDREEGYRSSGEDRKEAPSISVKKAGDEDPYGGSLSDSSSSIAAGVALDITRGDIDQVVEFKEMENNPPANTLRMWLMCIILAMVISGIDSFFAFRFPSISIGPIVAQLISYPAGVIWTRIMPNWKFSIGSSYTFELNPGPFSPQEQALVYLFCNTVIATGLLRNTQVEQIKFFKVNVGIGRFILFDIVGYLLAWGMAGLSIPMLVDREELIWPSVLSPSALINALHSGTKGSISDFRNPKFSFFMIAFAGSFVWYWFSDFIFPFIASLGAFPSWIRPKNKVLGQVFGVSNGLGLLPISFDWPTVSNISNPLTTPVWAGAMIFFSFFFWAWVVLPGLYYQNHWETAHLPLMSNKIFDKFGKNYQVGKVVNSKWELDLDKYKQYSPVFLPIGFLIQLALSLGGFSSMMIFFFWKFKSEVWDPFRQHSTKRTAHYKPAYNKFFIAAYIGSMILGLALGFVFVEAWNRDTQIDSGGFVVSIIIGIVLYLPVALVESKSSFTLNMNGFFNVVGAFWYKGRPMATLYFLNFGYSIFQHAMHFTQGAKLGYYMKTPPRLTMFVLFVAGIWASLVTPSVTGYVLYHVGNVCTAHAHNNMVCRSQQTAFNTQIIWGLFGSHLFSNGGRYQFIMYFFLVGAGVALIVIIMQWWRPKSRIWSHVSPTLLLSGAEDMPTSTGLHYGTWFMLIVVFNFFIHRKRPQWWRKYNLILASALDCGVAIAAIIVYFAVTYTGGGSHYKWWATEVTSSSCDSKGCPYKPSKNIKLPNGLW